MNCSKQTKIAIKTNPQLWEKVKKEILKGTKGSPANKWSARKSQLSVKRYKSLGGGYKGPKTKCNSLTKWSKEKWGYIKGSSSKYHKGRYLPEIVRKHLTPKERQQENKKKGSYRGKWIPYSKSVVKKMHKYKII